MRTICLLAMISASLAAQSAPAGRTMWDLTAGTGNGATSVSLGAALTRGALGDRVRLGLGLRSTYVGGTLKLTPAARNIPAGVVDTLATPVVALMLNVSGHAALVLTGRLHAGMNIDLVGLGAGGARTATYRASASATPLTVSASPARTNVFLYASNDRGSLNSEFFAAWMLSDRVALRGGLSHQLVEYETERALSSNTRRFRKYSNLLFVGLRAAR